MKKIFLQCMRTFNFFRHGKDLAQKVDFFGKENMLLNHQISYFGNYFDKVFEHFVFLP